MRIPEKKQKSKLHPRGEVGIFVGYTKTANQYQVYLNDSRKVCTYDANVVIFDESSLGTTDLSLDFDEDMSLGGEFNSLPRDEDDSNTPSVTSPTMSSSALGSSAIGSSATVTSTTTPRYMMSGGLGLDRTRAPMPKGSSILVGVARTLPPIAVMINATLSNRDVPDHSAPTESPEAQDSTRPSRSTLFGNSVLPAFGKSETSSNTPTPTSMIPRPAKRSTLLEEHQDAPANKIIRVHSAVEEDGDVYCTVEQETEARGTDVEHHGIDNPVPIPTSYDSAINDPIHGPLWKAAAEKEINDIIANDTFRIIKTPPDTNIVTARWVWNVKYTSNQLIDRYKARLVARGFTQVYGQDYWETFAPTIRADSLRLLLAIMALEDMEADQADVNNAFTRSGLTEKIYMHPPEGMSVPEGHILLVQKSLYGLKQSAYEWN